MRRKIVFWLNDGKFMTWFVEQGRVADAVGTWFIDTAERTLCFIWGHEATRDHCGLPEHDHCLWCRKAMPSAWPGRQELGGDRD